MVDYTVRLTRSFLKKNFEFSIFFCNERFSPRPNRKHFCVFFLQMKSGGCRWSFPIYQHPFGNLAIWHFKIKDLQEFFSPTELAIQRKRSSKRFLSATHLAIPIGEKKNNSGPPIWQSPNLKKTIFPPTYIWLHLKRFCTNIICIVFIFALLGHGQICLRNRGHHHCRLPGRWR